MSSSSSSYNSKEGSSLLEARVYDEKDEMDQTWYSHYYYMCKNFPEHRTFTNTSTHKPIAELLVEFQEKAQKKIDLNLAFLYGILTSSSEIELCQLYFALLTQLNSTDNCQKLLIRSLQPFLQTKYDRLKKKSKNKLLWLMQQLVQLQARDVDGLFISLLRFVVGGNIDPDNIWLCNQLVDIFLEHRQWLLSPMTVNLIPYVFHTFLRVSIMEHNAEPHRDLLEKEVKLCTLIWQEKKSDVSRLGRELVRLLSEGKEISGFATIWKEIRSQPDPENLEKMMKSECITISKLMSTRTPREYLQNRLTTQMETQLRFLMTNVHLGHQRRYQSWFAAAFLSKPENESLIPDVVRFICAVYHPSNQVLQSKVIPRWAVIGWLVKLCKRPNTDRQVKLALVIDYLYFDKNDNIMVVEPAVLLMMQSLRSYPDITISLLQYLFFAIENFASSPFNRQQMKRGVSAAFSMILKVGVVPSLRPLISSPPLLEKNPELVETMKRILPEHFSTKSLSAADSKAAVVNMQSDNSVLSPSRQSDLIKNSPIQGGDSNKYHINSPRSPRLLFESHDSPSRPSPKLIHSTPPQVARRTPDPNNSAKSSPAASPSPSYLISADSSPTHPSPSSPVINSNQSFMNNKSPTSDVVNCNPYYEDKQYIVGNFFLGKLQTSLLYFQKSVADLNSDPVSSNKSDAVNDKLLELLKAWGEKKDSGERINVDNDMEVEVKTSEELGYFIFKSLENYIISCCLDLEINSRNPSSKLFLISIFDFVFDMHKTKEEALVFSFLKGMLKEDCLLGHRLLCYSVQRSRNREKCVSMESSASRIDFSLYISFTKFVNSKLLASSPIDISDIIVQDILFSAQVDEAYNIANEFMTNSFEGSKFSTVKIAILHLIPNLIPLFPSLLTNEGGLVSSSKDSKLLLQKEKLLYFVCCYADPSVLLELCTLDTKELQFYNISYNNDKEENKVFLKQVISTLQWDSNVQRLAWQILVAQLTPQLSNLSLVLPFSIIRKILVCIDPVKHAIALDSFSNLLINFPLCTDGKQNDEIIPYLLLLPESFMVPFTCTLLFGWLEHQPANFSDLIASILRSNLATRLLKHLEYLWKTEEKFILYFKKLEAYSTPRIIRDFITKNNIQEEFPLLSSSVLVDESKNDNVVPPLKKRKAA